MVFTQKRGKADYWKLEKNSKIIPVIRRFTAFNGVKQCFTAYRDYLALGNR